jgi:hypothetical protein
LLQSTTYLAKSRVAKAVLDSTWLATNLRPLNLSTIRRHKNEMFWRCNMRSLGCDSKATVVSEKWPSCASQGQFERLELEEPSFSGAKRRICLELALVYRTIIGIAIWTPKASRKIGRMTLFPFTLFLKFKSALHVDAN